MTTKRITMPGGAMEVPQLSDLRTQLLSMGSDLSQETPCSPIITKCCDLSSVESTKRKVLL